jgi:phage/plasmid-like protein (TIGR03299 family)
MSATAIATPAEAKTPWRGIGFEIPENLSVAEVLKFAKLDWSVSKLPMYSAAPEYGLHDKPLLVPGNFSLFKHGPDLDSKCLGICGPDYKPFQNNEVFDLYHKFATAAKLRIETVGTFKDDKWIWALANTGGTFTLPGGDEVRGYLLLSHPHIWGHAFQIKFTTIYPVCWNTFCKALAEDQPTFRQTHTTSWSPAMANEAARCLDISLAQLEDHKAKAELMTKVKVTDQDALRYVCALVQPGLLEMANAAVAGLKNSGSLLELALGRAMSEIKTADLKRKAYQIYSAVKAQPGGGLESRKDTVWGLFNAVTYAADHELNMRDRSASLESAWSGEKAKLKIRAYDMAVKMAEAANA